MLPIAIPVTTPAPLIVALVASLRLQVPPLTALLSVTDEPVQTADAPVIAAIVGIGLTVSGIVAANTQLPNVVV
jgi:hypothetical protein